MPHIEEALVIVWWVLALAASTHPSSPARNRLNLSVVADVSGSMAASGKLGFVRQGLQRMVEARVLFEMQALRDTRGDLADFMRGL